MAKITINRALVMLKGMNVDSDARFIDIVQGSKEVTTSNMKVVDMVEKAKSDYKSVTDKIEQYSRIKSLIAASNAVNTVVIAGSIYTVTEAITIKNYKIRQLESLRSALLSQLRNINSNIEMLNRNIEKTADNMVSQSLSGGAKGQTEDIANLRDNYLKNFSYKVVDPLKISNEVDALNKKIEDFRNEVDIVLSEHNAKTEIEI